MKKYYQKMKINHILTLKNNVKRGTKKSQNFIKKFKILNIRNVKGKKSCGKVENFLQQAIQGRYYIGTMCH